ncbi:MAG TPA: hypothetical protein PKD00_03105 [Burkholderiales bacterium]|nr:hypothetical protein [Burkholderiales bacterium]
MEIIPIIIIGTILLILSVYYYFNLEKHMSIFAKLAFVIYCAILGALIVLMLIVISENTKLKVNCPEYERQELIYYKLKSND